MAASFTMSESAKFEKLCDEYIRRDREVMEMEKNLGERSKVLDQTKVALDRRSDYIQSLRVAQRAREQHHKEKNARYRENMNQWKRDNRELKVKDESLSAFIKSNPLLNYVVSLEPGAERDPISEAAYKVFQDRILAAEPEHEQDSGSAVDQVATDSVAVPVKAEQKK